MKTVIAIDRLVIDGLPLAPRERTILVSAFEAELGRLAAQKGIQPGTGFATDRVAAPPVAIAPGAGSASIGRHMAAALFAGIAGAGE